ncbi:lysophospholipid acyltransferase family protein [Schinkia azotoformans]|uniref:lysophospholipid acyltransferase family protein n=1 Tax=Schinkia azotoformans TaxID=1454 RepID=UPI002DB6D952|nr:lysophospholipid acyltransferase family protein [Schinkia azotoformans]MEC1719674.1 lysophospholipid acyltransferase family protein [Schinkia azotoformans]MED4412815.1 lysophospholipid acyltransferase family protein [Schinkia azotoformans]
MWLYKFGKALCSIYFKSQYKIEVVGTENIPKDGGVLLCSNHISNNDPPLVGVTCPRDISFMAKEELFRMPVIKTIMHGIRAFPVKRGMSDRNALKAGLSLLKEGNVLGLFPEGTRSKTGELGTGLAGAGFFALRSNAAVVPCAVIGPYKRFNKMKVVYGKPIDFEPIRAGKLSAQDATDIIMKEIGLLIENNALDRHST